MRIAYVNADRGAPVFGSKGSSIHVREVIEAFLRKGAEVHLFAARLGGNKPAGWEGVQIQELPAESQTPGEQSGLRTAMENSNGEFDFVYERYSLWSCAAMEWSREAGIPGILEINSPLIEEQKTYRSLSDPATAEDIAQRAFHAASSIVAVSNEVAAYVKGVIGANDKIRVIPNAINPCRFPASIKPSHPAPPGSFTVGFVGSLRPWHGLLTLVEAFDIFSRKCAGARLLIVGDGPEREAIMREIQRRGLTAITHLTGAVPATQVPGLLASMDLAAAPYPQLSSFYFSPLKVYEYMAAGRPVVASSIGQLQTLIQHGVTGWHVPPGDASALAEAIDFLRHQPELRQRLGQAAREFVLKHHTWDKVADDILKIAGRGRVVHQEQN